MKAAILDVRPAVAPERDPRNGATSHPVRRFSLERLPARRPLACRWRLGDDCRLAALWEPEQDSKSGAPCHQSVIVI